MPEPKKPRRKKASAVRKSYRSKEYICDSSRSGMLYAALVRSPSARGRITNITLRGLPEAYRLFTARDIPGENVLRTLGTDTEIFCTDRVHYVGEPVGIIVGPDPALVRKFAAEACVSFDSGAADGGSLLPAPAGLPEPAGARRRAEEAQAGGGAILAARTVRTGIFQNCASPEEAAAAFPEAGFDISGRWVHDEAVPDWLERSGALCHQDGATLTVLTATQWPSHLQQALSTATGIDEEHIEIKKTLSRGGNSSGVWRCSALAVQTALAAVLSGSPVKLTLSKIEQERFMKQGLKTWFSYRTAVDRNGVIQAMAIRIDADAGYANPFAQDIADRLTIAAASFYNPENLYICTNVHSSATPPSSFSPKAIDSQAFFAIENHIQQLADKTDLLPAELRSRNFGRQGAPFQFKIQRQEEVLSNLMAHSDFLRKYSSYRINSIEKKHTFFALPRRGIGMSCAYDGAYFYGTHLHPCEHKMEVTLNTDGTLAIHAVAPSAAVGEIWTKLAAEILEFDRNAIVIDSEASSMEQTALPESLYSDISIMTMLLRRCCAEIKRKRFHAPLPITAKKTPTPAMKRQWNKESFSGTPFYSTSFGAAAVEVELDANSYRKKIRGIWVSIDCGEILSPAAAERTVRLAIQQELEQLVKDETVRCRNINISFIKSGDAPCQIGTLVHSLIPAAFTAAISLAVTSPITTIPCLQEELYERIQNSAAQEDGGSARQDGTDGKKGDEAAERGGASSGQDGTDGGQEAPGRSGAEEQDSGGGAEALPGIGGGAAEEGASAEPAALPEPSKAAQSGSAAEPPVPQQPEPDGGDGAKAIALPEPDGGRTEDDAV